MSSQYTYFKKAMYVMRGLNWRELYYIKLTQMKDIYLINNFQARNNKYNRE